ncbi:MAG: PDZ domain-containing protein [Bryobacteraceae bacterium]|nr:PDZ domain-containing protein [Bryobacteraceae bacterium]
MRLVIHLSLLVFSCVPAVAQEAIQYTLRFPAPHTHYLEVEASIPAAGPQVELFMAVWTPGSYLVREYARNVEAFEARAAAGAPLQWSKSRKNRWRIETGGAARVTVKYRVYAREISVQGNWVDADFAMLNGAPNFMTLVNGEKRPYEVRLELPAAWAKSISGMKRKPGEAHTYAAEDLDELLDCPIYAGSAPIHEFVVAGKPHYLVNQGEGPMWDGPASARDVKRIVEEFTRMFGSLPYDHYVFFNMIVESGGGLEHKNSTWLNASRWAYGNNAEPPAPGAAGTRAPSRHRWLNLVSHEFFHTWNVKRLRPVALGPFDYENENYTPDLWMAEGFTSYYGPLALKRAGLASQERLLTDISSAIHTLQTTPGRLVQSMEDSSFNTWIKLYRPNENSANTAISYYTKGEVIAFLLDAKIRKLTRNARSLDDAMVLAYQRYGGDRGFKPEEWRAVCSEVAGADLSAWFDKVIGTTEELDYTEALDWYGLRFLPDAARRPVETGLATRGDAGRVVVSTVRRDTQGWDAGFNVDDEIIAVNGIRVRTTDWPARLDRYKEGETVRVLVARRDELRTIEMRVERRAAPSWILAPRQDATKQQRENWRALLHER